MILILTKLVIAVFVFSSIAYGVSVCRGISVSWIWSSENEYKTIFFGLQTRSSIFENVEERHRSAALFFLRVRNYSFVLFIVLSITDLVLQHVL